MHHAAKSEVFRELSRSPVFASPDAYRVNAYAASVRRLRTLFPIFVVALLGCACSAQTSLPFQVLNSKHKKWPADEAARIYFSACEMTARAIRPEQPPHLHPKFVLILGAEDNETVRYGDTSELRLKSWDPERFAQAVLLMAVRDVLPREQMADMIHSLVLSSQASVSVDDLKHPR